MLTVSVFLLILKIEGTKAMPATFVLAIVQGVMSRHKFLQRSRLVSFSARSG